MMDPSWDSKRWFKNVTTVGTPVYDSKVVDYLAHCLECQQVKEENQHPARLLHPLPIPE